MTQKLNRDTLIANGGIEMATKHETMALLIAGRVYNNLCEHYNNSYVPSGKADGSLVPVVVPTHVYQMIYDETIKVLDLAQQH